MAPGERGVRVCRAGAGAGVQEVLWVGIRIGVRGVYRYVCRVSVACVCMSGKYMCMWYI